MAADGVVGAGEDGADEERRAAAGEVVARVDAGPGRAGRRGRFGPLLGCGWGGEDAEVGAGVKGCEVAGLCGGVE